MFKLEEIRELVEMIDESKTIKEFSYNAETGKIKVKRMGEKPQKIETVIVKKEEPLKSEQPVITDIEEPSIEPTVQNEHENEHEDYEKIVSPMVGTFYAAPSPEEPPYVQVGDTVQENTVVCIVEAMKLINEIESEVNGEIVEVLV